MCRCVLLPIGSRYRAGHFRSLEPPQVRRRAARKTYYGPAAPPQRADSLTADSEAGPAPRPARRPAARPAAAAERAVSCGRRRGRGSQRQPAVRSTLRSNIIDARCTTAGCEPCRREKAEGGIDLAPPALVDFDVDVQSVRALLGLH